MSDSNNILTFFHCRRCYGQKPDHITMRNWARLEVGWTPKGIQVRCVRCDVSIIDLDFKGQKIGFNRGNGDEQLEGVPPRT